MTLATTDLFLSSHIIYFALPRMIFRSKLLTTYIFFFVFIINQYMDTRTTTNLTNVVYVHTLYTFLIQPYQKLIALMRKFICHLIHKVDQRAERTRPFNAVALIVGHEMM